jgi:polar amino acid transport system substrate-binding protein
MLFYIARVVLGALMLCILLPLPAATAAPSPGCSKAITLGAGMWEPYSFFDAKKRYTGIDADMARAIFKEAGCTLLILEGRPATRNLVLFEAGKIDMMTGASQTSERLRFARFTLRYRDERVGLFSLADRAGRYQSIRSFDDFLAGPHTMLAPRVGWYGDAYEIHRDRLLEDKRLFQFIDFPLGMRMLAAGRADFMMGDAAGVEHAAARLGVKVKPLPFWTVQAPVHLMLSRATVSAADVQRLDEAIVRLQKRGELDRILLSYGSM